jgi:hypothetical protein
MSIDANLYEGELTVALSGTGAPAGQVTMTPAALAYDASPGQVSNLPQVLVGATSGLFPVDVSNSGTSRIAITSLSITPPFSIATNSSGLAYLAAQSDCQVQLAFTPT